MCKLGPGEISLVNIPCWFCRGTRVLSLFVWLLTIVCNSSHRAILHFQSLQTCSSTHYTQVTYLKTINVYILKMYKFKIIYLIVIFLFSIFVGIILLNNMSDRICRIPGKSSKEGKTPNGVMVHFFSAGLLAWKTMPSNWMSNTFSIFVPNFVGVCSDG